MTPPPFMLPVLAAHFEQRPDRKIPGLPFTDYQALAGVNASLLREPTSYQMLERLTALNMLPVEQRAAMEFQGADTSTLIERVQEQTPRTVPRMFAALVRSPAPDEKPTSAQESLCNALRAGPVDSREFTATTLAICVKKGWVEQTQREVAEDTVSAQVKESRAFAFAIGRAVHAAILEPHMFDADTWEQHYQLSPSKGLTTKAAMEALYENPTRELITPEIIDTARRSRDAVHKHKLAAELLSQPGESELTVEAWDEEAACMRKIRIDRLPNDPAAGIIDIKTTRENLLTHPIRGTVFKNGYHSQGAFYIDTLAKVEPKPRDAYFLVGVTKEAPFIARVFELAQPMPDNLIEKGRDIYLERLATFALANAEQNWEAYENESAVPLGA